MGGSPAPTIYSSPDMPHPEHIEHKIVEAMKEAGIDPAIIYAYEKTGRLVTEENRNLLSDADLDEWQAAIEEYEDQPIKSRSIPPRHRRHLRPRRQKDHENGGWCH